MKHTQTHKTRQTGHGVVAASRITAKDCLADGFVDAVCLETGREQEEITREVREWLFHKGSQIKTPDNKQMESDSGKGFNESVL